MPISHSRNEFQINKDIELLHIAGPETGLPVLIATMHGKESVLAQPLAALGFRVLLPLGYDTDTLGTFSGDIRRMGTAFDAAIEKARRACQITGISRAISSEGSYRPCQTLFPGARNAELLAFVDLEKKKEFIEYRTDLPTKFVSGRVRPVITDPETCKLLFAMGWPEVRAMVVPRDPGLGIDPRFVYKGISDTESLHRAFLACAEHSEDGLVHLETDLRAHMNPTRMQSVALVTQLLVDRLDKEGYGVPELKVNDALVE